jgi:hypothetical protein
MLGLPKLNFQTNITRITLRLFEAVSLLCILVLLFLITSCSNRYPKQKIKQVRIEALYKNSVGNIVGESFSLPRDCISLLKWYSDKNVEDETSGAVLSSYIKYSSLCNAFAQYESSAQFSPKLDFISRIDFLSIDLTNVPWPCDLIELDPDACSPSVRQETIFDHFRKSLPHEELFKNPDNIKTTDHVLTISKSKPCNFKNGKFDKELFYNKVKEEFYCAKPSEKDTDPPATYSISPLMFTDGPLYADFNNDGFLDAMLQFTVPCANDCGSLNIRSGNVIFSRKELNENIVIIDNNSNF